MVCVEMVTIAWEGEIGYKSTFAPDPSNNPSQYLSLGKSGFNGLS